MTKKIALKASIQIKNFTSHNKFEGNNRGIQIWPLIFDM